MNKTILSSVFVFILGLGTMIHSTDLSSALLDSAGRPTDNLITLLTTLHIEHDGSLKSIVDATQKAWLRPADKERWEIADEYKDRADELMPLLTNLELIKTINPAQTHYDGIIVPGSLANNMKHRLECACTLVKKHNLRTHTIIMLVGQRDLDAQQEHDYIEQGLHTETDVARFLVTSLDLPSHITISIIDTPKQITAHGAVRRPTTADTVQQFLKNNPQQGTYLIVSNNPYIGYQHTVFRTLLPSTFILEGVGKGIKNNESISVILDALARWLYQEKQYRF